jgi:protein involved in polysaccharide export with SLBB domain
MLFLSLLQPSYAQNPADKESETNPYFNSGSSESLDLMRRYYRRQNSRREPSSRLNTESERDPANLLSPAALALEGPIDPAKYVVGPGDVLSILIGGVSPFAHAGPVTPEGALIIPTIGEVEVAGQTLAEVKKNVRAVVRKKYTAEDIGVHLLSLRAFKVAVVGSVANPGTYTVTPVDRVDRVVYFADLTAGSSQSADDADAKTYSKFSIPREEPLAVSLRNIKLYRAKQDTIAVDLVRYYATGETACNPYLRDGDVIFVPAENLLGNSVSIYGGVRQPSIFEFHEGDSLSTLLRLAQGPTVLADLERVEVVRFLPSGRQAQTLTVNLLAGQNGHTPDMALQRNDRIFIREDPEKRKERMIRVYGAVARPGEYAILYERTLLSEIIARAGGFRPDASIAEAKLMRTYENPDALHQNPDYARLYERRLMDLKPTDREYFDSESLLKRGFVAVDFVKLFNHHETAADVEVLENDEIFVPTVRQSINVFGQVNNPGYIIYLGGMDYRYYIDKAGGFSKEADRDKVRILKRNTAAWLKPGETALEPGDQIFVSRTVRRPASVYWSTARDVIYTTASVATVFLFYRQLNQ